MELSHTTLNINHCKADGNKPCNLCNEHCPLSVDMYMYIAGLQMTRITFWLHFVLNKCIWRWSPILTVLWWLAVYMDSYGTCQKSSFFEVHDEGYLVHAKGSGQPYQTMRCSLRFRAARDQQLCVKFNSFVINDCSVNFKVFQESQPIDFARQPKDECLFVSIKWLDLQVQF